MTDRIYETDESSDELQRGFWNTYNATYRELDFDEIPRRQSTVVVDWLSKLGRTDLDIIEVGCGAGWLCPFLTPFGRVTATDLADEVVDRARQRSPDVRFVTGDFMNLEFDPEGFDVVVSIEVLAHVADQQQCLAKMAGLLRPGGHLMIATQNKFVLKYFNKVPPPGPGQHRSWVGRRELRALLEPDFELQEMFSVTPRANRGLMRLVQSRMLNRPIHFLVGNRFERLKERLGLGWTLMVLAHKR